MIAFVRAALAAALVLILSVPASAADKPFKRDDLADAAIKLEAQIKAESGQITKNAATLRQLHGLRERLRALEKKTP